MIFVDAPQLETAGMSRAMMVRAFGARCAAWLLFKHRRRLRTAERAVSFGIPASAKLPTWFSLAFDFVRESRPAKWETSKSTRRGVTYYVFRWRRPPIPDVLRPLEKNS